MARISRIPIPSQLYERAMAYCDTHGIDFEEWLEFSIDLALLVRPEDALIPPPPPPVPARVIARLRASARARHP